LAALILDHDTESYQKIARALLDGRPSGGLTREPILDNITLYWPTRGATSTAPAVLGERTCSSSSRRTDAP
jgi:hypothetical protein